MQCNLIKQSFSFLLRLGRLTPQPLRVQRKMNDEIFFAFIFSFSRSFFLQKVFWIKNKKFCFFFLMYICISLCLIIIILLLLQVIFIITKIQLRINETILSSFMFFLISLTKTTPFFTLLFHALPKKIKYCTL